MMSTTPKNIFQYLFCFFFCSFFSIELPWAQFIPLHQNHLLYQTRHPVPQIPLKIHPFPFPHQIVIVPPNSLLPTTTLTIIIIHHLLRHFYHRTLTLYNRNNAVSWHLVLERAVRDRLAARVMSMLMLRQRRTMQPAIHRKSENTRNVSIRKYCALLCGE